VVLVRQGSGSVVFKNIKSALRNSRTFPLLILAIPVLVVIRLISPWLLVRWGSLYSSRVGEFALSTEIWLCEQDAGINVPRQRHVDIFFMLRPISNLQLATMWKRVLRVWPNWVRTPLNRANWLIPGGAIHKISINAQHDWDTHNLLDCFPPHLTFTAEEEARGEAGLRLMGIPAGTPFICLIARDSAFLNGLSPRNWSYHNYRDNDIQNYVLAAEEIANRGYFVVRMGAKVLDAIKSDHPMVIDYATNGMRNDFMDIYIGAKCEFCISGGSGFNAVPNIFRRPIAFGNVVPLGSIWTSREQFVAITKHYWSVQDNRELTVGEIINRDIGFSYQTSDYESKGIQLIENTPEEIRDIVIELVERLKGTWQPHKDDEDLQRKFWAIFPADYKSEDGTKLHGDVRSHFGTVFLRNNRDWVQLK